MQPYPIRFLRNLNRGREIATVLLNYGFGDLLERLGLRRYLNWGRRLISRKAREVPEELSTARRIRLALEELGPTFVKFGQVLSTRPDIVPADVIEELTLLQERVPPFPGTQARDLIEAELGRPIASLYASFGEAPLAAGSLAQVHRATSHDGRAFAVKVRRPGIVTVVERDLALLLELAELLERHVPESRIFDPVGLVRQFTRTIRRELNFRREARTMQDFARNFQGDLRLYVPHVESDLLSDSVLTMEFIDGIKPDDHDALLAARLDPARVAVDGANVFLRQAFEFGCFHGDPHPGNMRVRADGSIALLDFGMVGYLDDDKREQLVDLFVCIARHDVDRAVAVVQEIGHPTQEIDRALLQLDIRDFLDTYFGVALEQLKVGHLLNDFIGIMANHGLRCPGDLMLMIRAVITLEGVGRQLDPQFNLAAVLSPFIEDLIRQRYSPRKIAMRAADDFRKLVQTAHDLPFHLGRTLQKVSEDDFKIQLEHRGLDRLITEFDRSSNRVVIGLVTSALVVSTALILRSTGAPSIWLVSPIFVLSGLLGIWLVWGILRSGRL